MSETLEKMKTKEAGADAGKRRVRLAPFVPALLLLLFSLMWTGGLLMWPRTGEPVAAIFPPWMPNDKAVARAVKADAHEIWGHGGWRGVVIARADDAGFPARLHDVGALVVLRAPRIAGCMPRL